MLVSSPGLICVLLGLGSGKDALHDPGAGLADRSSPVTYHGGTKRGEMTRGDQSLRGRHEAKRMSQRQQRGGLGRGGGSDNSL